MAEQPKPLLMDKLTIVQEVMLGQTSLSPGYQILIMIMEEACRLATESTIKTDPEDPNYKQILESRQQYARAVNKFSSLVLNSVEWHINRAAAEQAEEEIEALAAIARDEQSEPQAN